MKQSEVEALADVAPILATVAAWRVFKREHDVAAVQVCCCETTRALFDALDQLERQMIAL